MEQGVRNDRGQREQQLLIPLPSLRGGVRGGESDILLPESEIYAILPFMDKNNWINKLYYGDNLNILRDFIPDESVDLIYLDPPFNSKATYNLLFKEKDGKASEAQIEAFDDTWQWDRSAEEIYYELVKDGPDRLSKLIEAMRTFLGCEAEQDLLFLEILKKHVILSSFTQNKRISIYSISSTENYPENL